MQSKPQTKKRHHQVPQLYLQRFASPATGQVWNYDKKAGKAWPRSIEDTAFERHLYSVTMEDGQRNTDLEDAIGRIEDLGAPLLERVICGEDLLCEERDAFASFVALMFVRTNAFRRLYAEIHGNMKMARDYLIASDDALFESKMEQFQADCGQLTEERKRKLRSTMLDPSDYVFHIDREFTLKALEYHDQLMPILSSMEWSILDTPKGDWHFITSDNPVVQWVPPQYRLPFIGRGGFMHKHAEVLFPLSPSQCWVGHWLTEMPKRFVTTGAWVKQANRIIAGSAERFLYSHIDSSGILKLAKKYAERQPITQMGAPGPINKAEIRVVRSLGSKLGDDS